MDSVNMKKPKPAPAYHHGNLRAGLIEAALALLDEAGVEAVTIRAVARRAGVTHAAPANHFRDRKALLTALATGIFAKLAGRIAAKLAAARGGRAARLQVFADAVTGFALAHPHRYRLLWRRDSLDDGDAGLQQAMDAIYDRLVAELSEDGASSVSADSRAVALWSMVHGYVALRLDGNFVALRDARTRAPRQAAIVTALIEGIGGEAKAKRKR